MFGCFGRRKKKNKDAAKSGDKGKAPEPKPAPRNDDSANKVVEKPAATQQQVVTPQIIVESHPQQNETDASAAEVTETITVTRSQSLHHAPPKPGNIKKAATMSRYDFLKKQDNINYADRWASLKQRYLANKTENGSVVADSDGPDLRSANGQPRSPLRAAVKSLPRQFSPTSAGPASPVKFSDWFYDRQTKETEARQEFHEREERMRVRTSSQSRICRWKRNALHIDNKNWCKEIVLGGSKMLEYCCNFSSLFCCDLSLPTIYCQTRKAGMPKLKQ